MGVVTANVHSEGRARLLRASLSTVLLGDAARCLLEHGEAMQRLFDERSHRCRARHFTDIA